MPVLSAQKSPLKLIIIAACVVGVGGIAWTFLGDTGPVGDAETGDAVAHISEAAVDAPSLEALDPSPLLFPADVLSIAGSSNMSDVLTRIGESVGQAFGAPIDLDAALRTRKTIFRRFTGLSGKFKLRNTSVLDFRRNLALVVFNPDKYGPEPSAYVVGFKDRPRMEKAFYKKGPKRIENDVEGNWGRYRASASAKTPIYVNFVGAHVIFTRHPRLFPDHATFFEAVTRHRFANDGALSVLISNGMNAFGQQLTQQLSAAQGLLGGMASTETPLQSAAQKALGLVDGLLKIAQSLDRLEGRLVLDADGARAMIKVHAKNGSPLEAQIASLKGRDLSVLKSIPSNAAAFGVLTLQNNPLLTGMADALAVIYALGSGADSPDDFKTFDRILGALRQSLTGDMAQMFLPLPDVPANRGQLTSTLLLPLANASDWSAQLKALSATVESMKTDAQGSGPFVDVTTSTARFKVAGNPVAQHTLRSPRFGVRIPPLYVWSNNTHVHVTSGRAARKTFSIFAGERGDSIAENPVLKHIMGQSATDVFAVAFLSPLAVLHSFNMRTANPLLKRLIGLPTNPLYGKLGSASKQSGVAVTVGRDAGQLEVGLHVPIQLVLDGANLLDTLKR